MQQNMSSKLKSVTVDQSKRARRHGPVPIAPDLLRTHHISVRLNSDELAKLDALRAPVRMQRGEFLRAAALHRLPRTIPGLNQVAWTELSRAASALNHIAHHINAASVAGREFMPEVSEAREVLSAFRLALINAKLDQ